MNFIVRVWEWEPHQPDVIVDNEFDTLHEAQKFFSKLTAEHRCQTNIELLLILDTHTFA